MSKISVVMVSYYTGSSLWLAIDSVLAQPECSELILVNNGNTPGVEALLAKRARQEKRINLITGQGNVGFAKACNIGAKRASADYLLLLNPDCMVPEGAFAKALEGIAPFPQNTLAGCYLANPGGSEQRGGRRGLLTPYNAFFESFGLSLMLPASQRLNLNQIKIPLGAHDVPAISGAFMLMATRFYEKMKGMDEDYFLHMEDMDFCYRVRKAGGKTICLPEVKIVHFRSTSDVSSNFVEREKAKSFIIYLRKHFTDEASRFATLLLSIAIWLRYYLKKAKSAVDGIFEPPLYAKQKTARLVLLNQITHFEKKPLTLAGRTMLVTGAGGQLGLCIVAELLARGAKVVAITHHSEPPFKHENLTWVERNLTAKEYPLEGADADTVIHAAPLPRLQRFMYRLSEAGTKRVIAFSCIPVLEKEFSEYAGEKKRAKEYQQSERELLATAEENHTRLTIFRPSNMYGVGLDSGLTKQADIIGRFGKLPLYYPGKGQRQPVHVRDVANAAMVALDNANTYGKTYAIGGATAMSYREMLEQVFAYLGKTPKFVKITYMPSILTFLGKIYSLPNVNGDVAKAMNRSVTVDNALPVQEFGYSARGFLEGDVGF